MKRFIALVLAFIMIMTLAACGSSEESAPAPAPAQEPAASEPAPQEEPAQEEGDGLITGFENNIRVWCDEGFTVEDAPSWMEFAVLKDGEEILRGMQSDAQQWNVYSNGKSSDATLLETTEDSILFRKVDSDRLVRMVKVSDLYVMVWEKPDADFSEDVVLDALNSVHFEIVE